jgi:hypothetical protein
MHRYTKEEEEEEGENKIMRQARKEREREKSELSVKRIDDDVSFIELDP